MAKKPKAPKGHRNHKKRPLEQAVPRLPELTPAAAAEVATTPARMPAHEDEVSNA